MNVEIKHKPLEKFFSLSDHFRWILLVIVTALFVAVIYPSLVVTHHAYKLGDVAEKDIKAPQDFFIEDQEATAVKRKQAVESVLTVYDHDTTVLGLLVDNVNQAFTSVRALIANPPSEIPPASGDEAPADTSLSSDATTPAPTQETIPTDPIRAYKPAFEAQMGIAISEGAYTILEKEAFSTEVSDLIVKILTAVIENGVVANKEILLRESSKGIVLRNIPDKTERFEQRLKQFYGLDQSKTMVRIIGQPLLAPLNYNLRNLIVDVVQRLIQPNITLNKSETAERRKKAAETIKPILYQIKAGEMLLREGERVNEIQLIKLNASQDRKDEQNVHFRSIGAAIILFCMLLIAYTLYIKPNSAFNRYLNKNLLCLATLFSLYIILVKISARFAELLAITPPLFYSRCMHDLWDPFSLGSHDCLSVYGPGNCPALCSDCFHVHGDHFPGSLGNIHLLFV